MPRPPHPVRDARTILTTALAAVLLLASSACTSGPTATTDVAVSDALPDGTPTANATRAAADDAVVATPAGLQAAGAGYRPAGGPRRNRSALVLDPFAGSEGWDVSPIFDIFRASEDHTRVVHLTDADVNPDAIASMGAFDAVHVMSHGGGSCPTWTDDRSECSSTFVGGSVDKAAFASERAAGDVNNAVHGVGLVIAASDPETLRWSFDEQAVRGLSGLDDTITFFAVCGSDFGFNNAGIGSSVAWSGTSLVDVVSPVAERFWTLMVGDGLSFDHARDLVKDAGLDQHNGLGSLRPDVNFFTEAVFAGRDLRARDVTEIRLDGNVPAGQGLQFAGTPEDGNPETFPTKDQQLTIEVEGVAIGSESGVTIDLYADGDQLEADIELARDGKVVAEGEDWATWRVVVDQDAVQLPDRRYADLESGAKMVELEVRVSGSSASEYTAHGGPVRLATDLVFAGPVPIFEELADGLPPNGQLEGNELRLTLNSGGGPVTGELHTTMSASGVPLGEWNMTLDGTHDPATGVLAGDVTGDSEGGIGPIRSSDSGTGTFDGTVDLAAGTATVTLGIGGLSQTVIATLLQ